MDVTKALDRRYLDVTSTSSAVRTSYEGVSCPSSILGSGVVRATPFSSPPLSHSRIAFFSPPHAPPAEEEVTGRYLVRDFIIDEVRRRCSRCDGCSRCIWCDHIAHVTERLAEKEARRRCNRGNRCNRAVYHLLRPQLTPRPRVAV